MADLIKLMDKSFLESANNELEELADIVFSKRLRLKLTQKELADKANVDVENIYKIEGGNIPVEDDVVKRVLGVLD